LEFIRQREFIPQNTDIVNLAQTRKPLFPVIIRQEQFYATFDMFKQFLHIKKKNIFRRQWINGQSHGYAFRILDFSYSKSPNKFQLEKPMSC